MIGDVSRAGSEGEIDIEEWVRAELPPPSEFRPHFLADNGRTLTCRREDFDPDAV